MNKKIIAILVAVMLLIVSAFVITSCNKDDETPTTTNPTTENVESTDENVSDDVTDKNDNAENSTNKNDEPQSTETQTPETSTNKTEPSTNDNSEPVTCETCGKVVVSDSYKGDMLVGDFCDGMCDEWYGEMDF